MRLPLDAALKLSPLSELVPGDLFFAVRGGDFPMSIRLVLGGGKVANGIYTMAVDGDHAYRISPIRDASVRCMRIPWKIESIDLPSRSDGDANAMGHLVVTDAGAFLRAQVDFGHGDVDPCVVNLVNWQLEDFLPNGVRSSFRSWSFFALDSLRTGDQLIARGPSADSVV